MRLSVCCVLLLVLAGTVTGQSRPVEVPVQAPVGLPDRQAQIDAATADAINKLMIDIADEPLGERLTVGAAIAQADSREAMRTVLKTANQIGGVRWLDEQTAQVQLEIDGAEVAAEIRRRLRQDAPAVEAQSAEIEASIAALGKKSFVATGSSTTTALIEMVQPLGLDGWAHVNEDARRAAIAAAKAQAVENVLKTVSDVRLSDGRTMASLLGSSGGLVRTRVHEHLAGRPVTAVRFPGGSEVEVTLSAPPQETFDVIRQALTESGAARLEDEEWARLRGAFLDEIGVVRGRGEIPRANLVLPIQPQVRLPEQPPIWVADMLDVQGTAEASGTQLKTMHAAKRQALTDLRAQVLELPLTPDLKIGQAASADPDIAAAVDRALARARTYKSDYYADGRVVVRTSLDLRDVWEQLHRNQP